MAIYYKEGSPCPILLRCQALYADVVCATFLPPTHFPAFRPLPCFMLIPCERKKRGMSSYFQILQWFVLQKNQNVRLGEALKGGMYQSPKSLDK